MNVRQNVRIIPAGVLVLIAILTVPAFAGEGRTPIWEPVAINDPGQYVVTRNITAPGTIIEILASGVDIDLNGMVLDASGGGLPAIYSGANNDITIRNGTIANDSTGVEIESAVNVVVHDLKVFGIAGGGGIGIFLNGSTNFDIAGNLVRGFNGAGIAAEGFGVAITGTIERNGVVNCQEGIVLGDASSAILKLNRVEQAFGSFGIHVMNSFGVLLDRNTVQDAVDHGIWVEASFACKIYNNLVLRSGVEGIFLMGTHDSFVLDNISSQNRNNGLVVDGERNHIERNLLNANGAGGVIGYGMALAGVGNVYRRNTARDNFGPGAVCAGVPPSSDLCDTGANTTDGDNYVPFLF